MDGQATDNAGTATNSLEFNFSDLDDLFASSSSMIEKKSPSLPPVPADYGTGALAGKFIAVSPKAGSRQPFTLVPIRGVENIPVWIPAAIVLGLAIMVLGMIYLPAVRLGQLTSRLSDANPAVVQSAMRELAQSRDERAVFRLHDLASDRESTMSIRLRAVDTLGLIRARGADNALLRLELAENAEPPIRAAAAAALKQRTRETSRERYR
ncbi:MAG: HEAT repeat domain-containing protein [Planctomycetota bacterium]|nr:HEAT repeat domain-containing protein [Planctomycetota bacterium]